MDNLFLRTVTSECPSVDPDAHAYRTNITAVPHDTKGDGNACHPVSYSYDTTDTKAHCEILDTMSGQKATLCLDGFGCPHSDKELHKHTQY